MSFQKVILIGNLGKDPEMRYTPNGQAVTNFSMATNRQYTNSEGEKVKEVAWFRVSCWGKLAEIASQYLHQGAQVMVEGRLKPEQQTGGPRVFTGNDGVARSSYEVDAEKVVFLKVDQKGGGRVQEQEEAPPF